MTVKSTVLGDIDIYWTDADPTVTPIDAAQGSWVFYQNGGMPAWFIKTDNGLTTNVGTVIARNVPAYGSVPGATDDITKGFRVFSKVEHLAEVYICVDDSVGAAVWKQIT